MIDAAKEFGRKISFTYNCFPGPVNVGSDAIAAINEAGGLAKGQSFLRIQGFLFAFDSRMHPFVPAKSFRRVRDQCAKEGTDMYAALRDPSIRAEILAEGRDLFHNKNASGDMRMSQLLRIFQPFRLLYVYTESYEPEPEHSIEALAEREGKEPIEAMYDHLAAGGILWKPQIGLYDGTMDRNMEFMERDDMIPGFADSGAHGTIIQDAVAATHSLTHWVRDRHQGNGRRFPIETVVRKQTGDVAELFGLDDVGTLEVGKKANLNVFNLDSLQIHEPFVTNDWMRRWTQKVDGYVLTLVKGVPTYRQGRPTGALPGSLVRNPRADKSKFKNIARKVSSAFDGFVPDFREEGEDSFEGMGDKGGSAAARLMRETLESGDQARSKL